MGIVSRSEWLPDGTWVDPDCVECGGEGAPCCDPPDHPPPGVRAWVRWWIVGPLRCLPETVEWWLRPYDFVADTRRWRWQQPAPCGRMLPPDLRAALTEAAREYVRRKGER